MQNVESGPAERCEGILNKDAADALAAVQASGKNSLRAGVDRGCHNERVPEVDLRLVFDAERRRYFRRRGFTAPRDVTAYDVLSRAGEINRYDSSMAAEPEQPPAQKPGAPATHLRLLIIGTLSCCPGQRQSYFGRADLSRRTWRCSRPR